MDNPIRIAGLLTIVILAVGARASTSTGGLELSADRWDIGKTNATQTITKQFVLRNSSNDTIRVTDIRPTCGCVDAALERTTLRPNDEVTVTVTMDPSSRRGAGQTNVRISTDDNRPPKMIRITYDVQRPEGPRLALEPMSQHLGLMLPGQSLATTVHLSNTGTEILTIETLAALPSEWAWQTPAPTFPLELPAGESLQLTMLVTPDAVHGLYQKAIGFVSNDPSQRRHFFAISAYVSSRSEIETVLQRKPAAIADNLIVQDDSVTKRTGDE